ncbi:MAG: LLM class flavin-dependent oxidoreductase, partial [Hyphomicrobiaceae bacterium]|nr:LLM class flavin-dependent oxidoreductase [Hyphomicrobiaceae bacterium]
PASHTDFLSPDYYARIGRALEAGKFHLAFFDDRLAMPDILGDDHRAAVENGIRVVKMDPATLLMVIGQATERLGLGSTYSTTYYEPFHVARVFATMDHMLKGRVAWNVVTSLNRSEARNFSQVDHPAHDLRYDKADEFMEVVLGHWDSWADDALIVDKETGRFADADKVKRLDHDGQWFRSRGPFTVPRTPQGRPVLIQAGQSGRGQAFAAQWGELVFAIYHSIEAGKKTYKGFKDQVIKFGRDPGKVRVAPAVYLIPGETQAIAEAKREMIDSLARPVDALALLSEVLNFDFASKPMDEPFTQDELDGISGLRGILDRVVQVSGKAHPTLDDFVRFSNRGTIREFPVFCGTGKQIADQMEEWFVGEACDGFVVAATSLPGNYEDVSRLVIPELQKRGLFRKEYEGATLRENLGLGRAEPGDWKVNA